MRCIEAHPLRLEGKYGGMDATLAQEAKQLVTDLSLERKRCNR